MREKNDKLESDMYPAVDLNSYVELSSSNPSGDLLKVYLEAQ